MNVVREGDSDSGNKNSPGKVSPLVKEESVKKKLVGGSMNEVLNEMPAEAIKGTNTGSLNELEENFDPYVSKVSGDSNNNKNRKVRINPASRKNSGKRWRLGEIISVKLCFAWYILSTNDEHLSDVEQFRNGKTQPNNVSLPKVKITKTSSIESNTNELYHRKCVLCNETWGFLKTFIEHLEDVHSITAFNMRLPSLPPPQIVNRGRICRGCGIECTTKKIYYCHVKREHSVVTTSIKSKEPQFYLSDPNNHCIECCQTEGVHDAFHVQSCIGTYNNKNEYDIHLLEVHGINLREKMMNLLLSELMFFLIRMILIIIAGFAKGFMERDPVTDTILMRGVHNM
ncbi:unnamed protein product [Mucor hiemalis]